MFGSSKKQIIFSPSTFANNRRHRRTPSWLIIFLLGIIIGGVGLWFLQTNYGQKKLSLEESQRLQQDFLNLTQEKENLEQQLIAANNSINEAHLIIQQLQPTAPTTNPTTGNNGDTASKVENNPSIDSILKNIPNDPENTPIGIRIGNFTGSLGELSYDIVLSKRDTNDPNIPIKVNLFAMGSYLNGKPGFDYLAPIATTSDKYVRLQGKVKLSKPTLTPQKIEIKVVNANTKKVVGKRLFTATSQNKKGVSANKNTSN